MLTPDQKYELAIDRATDQRRAMLSPEELELLTSFAAFYRQHGFFSMETKQAAFPILKRLGVFPP